MAIRNSTTDVCRLLGLDSTDDVFTFMQVATQYVDTLLLGKGLSDGLLAQIELMISAHFYRLSTPDISQESYGDAKFSYLRGKMGEGLSQTTWGQMAMTLDTSGTLKDVGLVRASLSAL